MNGIFRGKMYGTVTVGERGQLVIPSGLRKELHIRPGDRLMIFAKPDRRVINLMPEKDFNQFLEKASKIISKLEDRIQKKS